MRVDLSVFRSRVAARVFFLFFLLVLLPLMVTGVMAWRHIDSVQSESTKTELQRISSEFGLNVYERLRVLAARLDEFSEASIINARRDLSDTRYISDLFVGVAKVKANGSMQPLFGAVTMAPTLSKVDHSRLTDGDPLLKLVKNEHGVVKIILITQNTRYSSSDGALLIAEPKPEYLFGEKSSLPHDFEYQVVSQDGVSLFSTDRHDASHPGQLTNTGSATKGPIEWDVHGERQIGNVWRLFLEPSFGTESWSILVSRPHTRFKNAQSEYTVPFILAGVLSLIAILLLAILQIRKHLVPVERLLEGTRKIAAGEFSTTVNISSGDEFEELGDSFNTMAGTLEEHFKTLALLSRFDRVILASNGTEATAALVLRELPGIVPSDRITLTVSASRLTGKSRQTFTLSEDRKIVESHSDECPENEIDLEFESGRNQYTLTDDIWPSALQTHADAGIARVKTYSANNASAMIATICVGYRESTKIDDRSEKILRDVCERVSVAMAAIDQKHALHEQANYDYLTGLPNRNLIVDILNGMLAGQKGIVPRVAVLFVDLDNFKIVNDSVGHAFGDSLLIQAGHRIRETVGEDGFVGRLGGDEFVISLQGDDLDVRGINIARKIIHCLAQPFVVGSRELFVAGSIGISRTPDDGATAEDLLRTADTAMYNAKSTGPGRFRFFEKEMNNQLSKRLSIETDLRSALANDEFFLVYQPLVPMIQDYGLRCEVLIRWEHPERGLISPDEFIEVAEQIGLIEDIGEWVIKESCRQCAVWKNEGLELDRISINLSARQLRNSRVVAYVDQCVAENGISHQDLELEVTESVFISDAQEAVQILRDLRSRGCTIGVDDFGTGYSSLNYLRQFDFDTLKIDRCFTEEVLTDTKTAEIVKAVVNMCHALDKEIVMEGVETNRQARFLTDHGIQYCQGYLFSRPLVADDLFTFAQNQTKQVVNL